MALRAEPDRQRHVVEALRRWEIDPPEYASLLDPFEYTTSANYVVPMLLALAIARGNELVDAIPRYSSIDHAVNFQTLISALRRFDAFVVPYFDRPTFPDPFAEELLAFEWRKAERRHLVESFEQGIWHLVSDDEGLRIHLSAPMRRSALHLVANAAAHAQLPADVRRRMKRKPGPNDDLAGLAIAAGNDALGLLAKSCPKAWERLWAQLPFSPQLTVGIRALALSLAATGDRWFPPDELWPRWERFARSRRLEPADREAFEACLSVHTLSPEQAQEWGLQAPFLRLGRSVALWPFAFHVMLPDLGLISLLTRHYEDLWSRTLGSDLARVADRLAGRLASDRLAVAARRRKKDVGEADLVVLDRETAYVAVLELKTTYDKFRSHIQLRNFTHQRVNFPKAIGQATAAADAIRDGGWTLHDIFGPEAPDAPSAVTPGVLTWWDTFNPTLDTDSPILACNFATFEFVVRSARDDLGAAVVSIAELASVHCPGVLLPGEVVVGDERWSICREVQGDALPPVADMPPISSLTERLIAQMPRWPDDWRRRLASAEPAGFVYEPGRPES